MEMQKVRRGTPAPELAESEDGEAEDKEEQEEEEEEEDEVNFANSANSEKARRRNRSQPAGTLGNQRILSGHDFWAYLCICKW